MSAENLHITSWVVLSHNIALHNGSAFFKKEDADELTFLKELYRKLECDYPKFFKMDNLCKLAFIATELLLNNGLPDYKSDEVALVFSNAGASLDTDRFYYRSVEDKSNYFPSPAVFVYTLPNIMMGEVCIRHKFLGENIFFISENFDAGLLSEYSTSLITSGKAKCVITGWVEINEHEWEACLFLAEGKSFNADGEPFSPLTLERIYSATGVKS